jgi:hypothetical protein
VFDLNGFFLVGAGRYADYDAMQQKPIDGHGAPSLDSAINEPISEQRVVECNDCNGCHHN